MNQSIQPSISDIKSDVARHDNTLTELQDCASNHSDTIATLQATVERLSAEVKKLDERCGALEALQEESFKNCRRRHRGTQDD